MENFAPGVMDRLKLDYESVKKIKKDIIYCSISCFGHWGPYSHKPGYDMIAQGASGWTGQSEPADHRPRLHRRHDGLHARLHGHPGGAAPPDEDRAWGRTSTFP